MQNQFFYTRKEIIKGEGDESSEMEFRDSFNIDKVIRSRQNPDGTVLILIDDIHERSVEVPDINTKTNKMIGKKRERNTYQSEIIISQEDGQRFYKITSLD